MARDALVLPIAHAQYGLVSRRQALAAGMSGPVIDRRIRRGEWEPVAPGVYRLSGASPSWHQRAFAACLQSEPHGALSHRSAAYVYRLDGLNRQAPEPIELVVPRGHRHVTDVTVHETRTFERELYKGMPVTPLSRTLLDLAPVLTELELEMAMDSAMRFGRRCLHALEKRLKNVRQHGRTGIQTLRELLEAYDGTLDSALEVLVRKLLFAAGLPKPAVHYEVWHQRRFIANVDFAWPRAKLVVQAHGLKFHLNRFRYRIDQRQQTQMLAAGWRPVVITWDEAHARPAELIDCVRATWERCVREATLLPGVH